MSNFIWVNISEVFRSVKSRQIPLLRRG